MNNEFKTAMILAIAATFIFLSGMAFEMRMCKDGYIDCRATLLTPDGE